MIKSNLRQPAKSARGAVIYHIIVDRFCVDNNGVADGVTLLDGRDIGNFHGGTVAGVTRKIREGWFSELGINTLLISPIYEQIAGWVPSAGNEFRHHAYHGYFALDYTVMDKRFGDEASLSELVRCAHANGMSIFLDVVLNHPGYPDPSTFRQLGLAGWKEGWEMAEPDSFHSYIDRDSSLSDWWGPDWVRYCAPGYPPGGNDDYTTLLHGLPDFKTESEQLVSLPFFFRNKSYTKAVDLPNTTVRGYLVKWLSDWVLEYGFDGFRCDSAKHVEPETWMTLKEACVKAKHAWWEQNRDHAGATPDFQLLGEVYGHGAERTSYFDWGIDSILNFSFQGVVENNCPLDLVYEDYATRLHEHADLSFVSYLSSHDTYLFDRKRLRDASTALMLAPGGVLLLYGDETGRLPEVSSESDPAQATRSPMNWHTVDSQLLVHWRKLARFRAGHPAIAFGIHLRICDQPYVFARLNNDGDGVVVAMVMNESVSIPVSLIFIDGQNVRDAYSGWRGTVVNGCVSLKAEAVVLLEVDEGDACCSHVSYKKEVAL